MSHFIFDNISSQKFKLQIASIGDSGAIARSTYSDIEITKDRSSKRVEPYVYGTKLSESLVLPYEIYHEDGGYYELYEVIVIQEWLFGRAEAKYLTILEAGLGNQSYLCWLTEPSIVRHGGKDVGWRFNVVTVAPYAFTDIIEQSYVLMSDSGIIDFHNLSSIEDYLRPEMSIRLLGNTTSILIQNQNDKNRVFQITNIRQGDSIYVDNDRQIILSESGDNVLDNFNLKWLRFALGRNRLFINGRCELAFKVRFKIAIGGY